MYIKDDENVQSYLELCALRRAPGDEQLTLVIAEMESCTMTTLG